jgi:hypothetical protein
MEVEAMKRLIVLAVVGVLAAGAALLPEPPAPQEPLAGLIIDRPGLDSPLEASIWYCPWAQANAGRDSFLSVVSQEAATVSLTLPVAIPGEDPDEATLRTLGPGAAEVDLSDIAVRGDSPGFFEFDAGPAAASVTIAGAEVLTADACVSSGPDVWYFPGGSTMAGETLTLRLFNPFPETAKVNVGGVSEIGTEALGELRSVSVNPRSWRDVAFEELLRQRQNLVITVTTDEGLIVPAMAMTDAEGEAWWPGTAVSQKWEFPVVRTGGLDDASLVLSNPGLASASVTVDVLTPTGPRPSAFTLELAGGSPGRVSFAAISDEVIGARVIADVPISAAVVARGEAGLAITPGVASPARTWLLPGLQTFGLQEGSLWLLNGGEEVVSITVTAIGLDGVVAENVPVEAGSLIEIPASDGAIGYMATASQPFSAAWSTTGPGGIAFASGSPVTDE